jgi:hypothetical protein
VVYLSIVRVKETMSKPQEPSYVWDVKLDENLRHPVRQIAFDNNLEIRKIVSDAVRDYLKKQKTKAGGK